MTASQKLYEKIVLKGPSGRANVPMAKTYKGFSTVSQETKSFSLYDFALIKQDLINHFHVRQGERLENPEFGTAIWDYIFEPLTEESRLAIIQDVETIINYDPRITSSEPAVITQYESGLQIECRLTYLPYNIQESIRLKFDQANGLVSN